MASELCTDTLGHLSSLIQFHRTFMLAYCILLMLFSVVAVLGNVLVIHALWKVSSIPSNIKKLFLSLAFSDLAVGMLPQLMLGVNIAVMLSQTSNGDRNLASFCPVIVTACYFFIFLLCSASFLTIGAIAVDRLLAILLHLRYRELVTSKRVNMALIMVWLTSSFAASISILLTVGNMVIATVQFILLLLTTVAYVRIFNAVKYHNNQIQSQLQLQSVQVVDLLRQKKSAVNALVVYAVFLVCYLPIFVVAILLLTYGERISMLVANYISIFFVFLNSSLNPFVYYSRYREIRIIMRNTIKK